MAAARAGVWAGGGGAGGAAGLGAKGLGVGGLGLAGLAAKGAGLGGGAGVQLVTRRTTKPSTRTATARPARNRSASEGLNLTRPTTHGARARSMMKFAKLSLCGGVPLL